MKEIDVRSPSESSPPGLAGPAASELALVLASKSRCRGITEVENHLRNPRKRDLKRRTERPSFQIRLFELSVKRHDF